MLQAWVVKIEQREAATIFVITVIPILIIVASIFYITAISSIIVLNWDSAAFGSGSTSLNLILLLLLQQLLLLLLVIRLLPLSLWWVVHPDHTGWPSRLPPPPPCLSRKHSLGP